MKQLLLTLAFCAGFLFSEAQQNKLYMQSGTVITAPNLQQFINDESPKPNEIFNGYYYRILQFNDVPTSAQKQTIAATGILLLNYFPDKAFVAAIPAGYQKEKLQNFNIYSVVKQDAVQKTNHSLLGEAPDYSRKVKGYTDVMVQYYKNIPHDVAMSAFAAFEKLSENKTIHTLTLRIPDSEVRGVAEMSLVFYLSPAGVPSLPEDVKGRSLHRSNVINSDYASGYHYDGSGVVVGIADDGDVGPHIDFKGRLTNHQAGTGGSHGDMTGGICVGAGNLNPAIKGMATGAYLHIYPISGYPHVIDAVSNYNTLGTVILSTSYSQGCNSYTPETQLGDQLLHQNPQLEFVFSAGNNGTGSCTTNPYGAGSTWGTITGGYKQGKNVIACGNLTPLDVIDNSSSRGPAHDGRIKPDICANGTDQLSTDANNSYQVGGGTSAASPGIAGICAQLYQAYKSMNGGMEPESPLIKASLLNSAEDLGNTGPDYTYGWGRVNAYRALKTLEEGRYIKDSISQGELKTHSITVPPGVSDFRVMIYWLDPEGVPGAAKALVNDINMHLSDPINFDWFPWVLNPAPNATALTTPAVTGTDSLNNMEQVSVAAGFQGTWTVNVNGHSIPLGPQTYYIVYEFRTEDIKVTYPQGGEGFVPGETEVIRWDAVKGLGNFTVEYSTDAGMNWNVISSVVNQNILSYNWAVPSTVTGEALIRVSRGGFSAVSDTLFAIIGTANNIAVGYACVDSIHLVWDAVTGAVGYEVYQLGNTHMEYIGTSLVNNFTVTGTNPNDEYWFSVSPVTAEGTKGRRAYAFQKLPGVINCPLSDDAGLTAILSPAEGALTDCMNNSSISVSILIDNPGLNDINGLTASYQLNNNAVITENITDTIPAGSSLVYSFTVPVDYSALGTYTLSAWISYTGDQNIYNDSAMNVTTVISGTMVNLPFSDNFQSYNNCGTASDCESTICTMGSGWINEENLTIDDIDFRVSAGATPTTNSGPATDHTTGTASGQYIYLEASVCFNKTAQLLTPCINLTSNTGPRMQFWYHMFGATMGELHVDVLSGAAWTEDVIAPVTGNQGDVWRLATVDLSAFAGNTIVIRFRGITGSGATSDIAIDDISIIETNIAPSPAFEANFTAACVGSTVTLNDKSTFSPTMWQWNISPSTFAFVNSTTSSSQNPQVQFTATGTYSIELVASNAFGSDSVTISSYIEVVAPSSLSLTEDFQGAAWPPSGWRVESAGNNFTWNAAYNITGSNGVLTNVAYINNYDYSPIGGQDGMARLEVDLASAITPMMTFDISHARFNAFTSDGLRIDISTDCGNTYTPSVYFKQGAALATTANSTSPFTPSSASQWRNDTLDLTPYAGQAVTIKFVNISASGNNIYIDNINVSDFTSISETALNANVTIYPNPSLGGWFTVTVNGITDASAEFTVTDIQGKTVEQNHVPMTSVYSGNINLSGKDKGIYFLEIRTQSGTSRYKLTVI